MASILEKRILERVFVKDTTLDLWKQGGPRERAGMNQIASMRG